VISSKRFRDNTEDIDLNKNHHSGSSNRTLWVAWRRIRGSRAPALAHLEHIVAANIMLGRARTAARVPGTGTAGQALCQGVQHALGCLKSITAARLEA